MVSVNYVIAELQDQASNVLALMQEADSRHGFINIEWADAMYDAHELINKAIRSLGEALNLEG